jgi:hypothetical protein
MSQLAFFLNPPEKCPRCDGDVKLSYIEVDDNGEAVLYYACEKCVEVKVRTYKLR